MSKLFEKILAAAICALAFFSCDNLISFKQLSCDVSMNAKAAYYKAENIEVIFSSVMLTQTVESNIVLKKDGAIIDTDIVWQNTKCLVKPIGGFCLGQEYSFSLKGQVVTSDGRAYDVDISRKFIFGDESKIFSMEKAVAPCGNDSNLEFYFNKEIDVASFEQEFNISPYIEMKKTFSENKKSVTITPCDKWQNNTFYTWTIENILSADGYRICKTYSDNFMAVNENERADIECVCPVLLDGSLDANKAIFLKEQDLSALSGKKPLGIIFTKPMDADSVKSALYFDPAISGVLLQTDECSFVYVPYDNYKIEQEYLLQIGENAKDIYGLKIKAQRNFYFTGADEFLKIDYVTANETLVEKNKIKEIASAVNGTLFVIICFSSPIANETFSKIENAISLSVLFPNTSNPAKLNSIYVKENCIEAKWNNLSELSNGTDCVYKLKILGGKNYLATNIGTYLEEDECFYLRIE